MVRLGSPQALSRLRWRLDHSHQSPTSIARSMLPRVRQWRVSVVKASLLERECDCKRRPEAECWIFIAHKRWHRTCCDEREMSKFRCEFCKHRHAPRFDIANISRDN